MTLATQKTGMASRLGTIRVRLVAAFLAVALLPFTGISFIFLVSGAQGGQQETLTQLETVTSYKENALRNWTTSLRIELNNAMVGGDTTNNVQEFLVIAPASAEAIEKRYLYDAIRERFLSQVEQSLYFDEFFLLNMDGVVALSTNNSQEGQDYQERLFFRIGQQSPYIEAPYYSKALSRTIIYASAPIYDQNRQVIGVLAGRARTSPLNDIINDRAGLGESGVTFLISMDRSLIAGLDPDLQGQKMQTGGVLAAFGGEVTGARAYKNDKGVMVLGLYRWLPDLQAVLLAEQDRIESARVAYANLAINISVALASILIALFLALVVTRTIASPVSDLAETATLIAAGESNLSAPVEREDEIGVLARAFNSMTSQLNALITSLEQRVAQRTRELEVRSNYLQASAEVSRAAGSILDPDQLVEQVVEFIRERFNLYYVGLFLADERHEWAVLRAGTGHAGQIMLERGHRLPIGSASMIGWSIANAQARVAQEAIADMVRAPTPELPDTRSEAALPLRSRGQVIGAISVQSDQPNAFDDTIIGVLQSMADQLAVAIDNARLFSSSQQALEAERRAYAAQSRLSWDAWLKAQARYSLRADARGVSRTEYVWLPEMDSAFQQDSTVQTPERLSVPVRVRGHVIGVLNLNRGPQNPAWSSDDVAFLEGVADQLGVALDSARLYTETQQRAEQERLVSQATGRMRESLDVETVLKTAIEEIYSALGLENLVIQLTPQNIESPAFEQRAQPNSPPESQPSHQPTATSETVSEDAAVAEEQTSKEAL
ncbi:MAG: GAF domain-containing protein [Anaerolineales bacterium]|nr:GAF domain-containing protein [Anaerolineales bacterium]